MAGLWWCRYLINNYPFQFSSVRYWMKIIRHIEKIRHSVHFEHAARYTALKFATSEKLATFMPLGRVFKLNIRLCLPSLSSV